MSDNGDSNEKAQSYIHFYVVDGKTYYGEKEKLLGDFTLKVIGEMKLATEGSAGHWVCSCGTADIRAVTTRRIVLNINCFGTKQRFVDSLRESYGGGTFLLGPQVTGAVIQMYATYLKDDYEGGQFKRYFFEPTFMGYQGNKYWLVSNKLHIEQGRVLRADEFKFVPMDESLSHYQLEINPQLIMNSENLKESLRRFFILACGFGQNAVPFQMTTAFIVGRLIRNALQPDNVWTESSIGMVFSECKCVGKSLSLLVLALAQGIPSRVHLMFLSGGNQLLCGTSSKKMQQSLSKTTGVVMIDDPDSSRPFSEFLLQVQGRLMSGSNKEGMSSPKASPLLSSNSPELARLIGRVIRFNYIAPAEDKPPHNPEQLDKLLLFMEENKGILLAWAIRYLDFWEQVSSESMATISKVLKNVLAEFNQQDRWLKGVSTMVLANTLLRISIGKNGRTNEYLWHICEEVALEQASGASTMEKIEQLIVGKIKKNDEPILTWLHPLLTVIDNSGRKVKAVAIVSSLIEDYPAISHTEFQEEYAKQVAEPKTIGIYYCPKEQGTYAVKDLANRKNLCQRRSHRFPIENFTSYAIHLIHYACQMRSDPPIEEEEHESVPTRTDLTQEEADILHSLDEELKRKMEAWEMDVNETGTGQSQATYNDNITEVLTPNSKRVYRELTPQKRKAFTMGLEAGNKMTRIETPLDSHIGSRSNVSHAVSAQTLTTCTLENTEVPHVQQPEPTDTPLARDSDRDQHGARKQLFAEGTFGVLPRAVHDSVVVAETDKEMATTSSDYKWCKCKQEKNEKEEKTMLLCETKLEEKCPGNTYYHLECLGLKTVPKGKWLCLACNEREKGGRKRQGNGRKQKV